MKVEIDATDGRVLARVINLAARIGCMVERCEMAQNEDGARIVAEFSGDQQQLRRLGGQLSRMLDDERAHARFCTV
ncbi:MAG: hypothetical protein ACRENA_16335 [Vulcanimicrobiaceae bacterium]